jgi:hypothetical protein
MLVAIRYHFAQILSAPAQKAYEWCTTFTNEDYVIMNKVNAERQVTHLAEGTMILTDVFHSNGNVVKQKLVQLYPERLHWTSTHLSGPNRYSQFVYEISPVNEFESKLDFYGLHVENEKERLSQTSMRMLAKKECKADSNVWKLLAKAMASELRK